MVGSFPLLPVSFLQGMLPELHAEDALRAYEAWWEEEGKGISEATDRAGTPWVRMFDRLGKRADEILMNPSYRGMIQKGYQEGVLWRIFEEGSVLSSYLLGYVASFYDPGLYCPYTVSLSTAVPLDKYGAEALKERFLPHLLRRDGTAWQGATWMTEARGGSDLGATVETVARRHGDGWLLDGDKYFCSNVGAELVVVAARPEGAPHDVRGLALFLVPRRREDGELNYFVRRLKDKVSTRSVPTGEVELRESEAYLLGTTESGIYMIMDVLNFSRVANAIGSVAVAQRAMADAFGFAEERVAFGKPIIQHPLMARQFEKRLSDLREAFALAWESVELLNETWRETPPFSERHHLLRVMAHLAKYWTAELAAQTAKWSMEVHGGMGVLAEYGVERWLREAMVLCIWEGTPHRQMLDGLEVMERKQAHRMLFERLQPFADPRELAEMSSRVDAHLALPQPEKEARAEEIFPDLARFTARALLTKLT
jgi:alkylation response protein AidB-like acyl-CoA dehydrogenase